MSCRCAFLEATKKPLLFLKLALGLEFKNMPSERGDDVSMMRCLCRCCWLFRSCSFNSMVDSVSCMRMDRRRDRPSPYMPGLIETLVWDNEEAAAGIWEEKEEGKAPEGAVTGV